MEQPSSSSLSRRGYRRVGFPPERRLVLDTLRLGHSKPMMHGFLELDVTRARQMLRAHREHSGEALSFTAFVLACLGKSVSAHPEVHAMRDWCGKLILFEDVDATTIVEVEVEGRPFALAHVVRGINRRSVRDIHDELRSVKTSGMRSVASRVRLAARIFLSVPGFLRRLIYRGLLRFPRLAKRHTGTMLVTSLGMFGGGVTGWGVSAPGIHNFSVVVGGIAVRPHPDSAGEPREVLCVTVSANHDLVDGAPVTRFVRDLAQTLAAADFLRDALSEPNHHG
jgi:pyruvate/2-oxoglutarate dehydrogenase complex dihydrolipoamide acyltransferase (E2) component